MITNKKEYCKRRMMESVNRLEEAAIDDIIRKYIMLRNKNENSGPAGYTLENIAAIIESDVDFYENIRKEIINIFD